MASLWNNKTALVTGGAGFLGSHVVDRLMSEGYKVVILDNLYTGTLDNVAHHLTHPRLSFVQHDVSKEFPLSIESQQFDLIFHLACAASPVHYQADPIGTTMTCVMGTHHALKTAMRCKCPILISSTSEVYGDPNVHPQPETYWGNTNCIGIRSCYDEGKRCAEALCFDYNRLYGVKIRVARIFNTYGPRMCFNDGRIISNFVVQALTNQPITVYGTGEYTRSFQFCEDLVEGFFRLINHPTEIGPVNLGNPEEYTVLEMAKKIKAMVAGSTSEIVFKPAAQDDPKQRRPDITKAKAVLNGWTPSITVAAGLEKTIEEFKTRLLKDKCHQLPLYVECNPLLDISAHTDAAFQAKYGLSAGSIGLATPEQMPIYGELAAMKSVMYIPGGSGLNTARVAQWMSQAPKCSWVSYVGAIADDRNGLTLKTAAEADGVNMLVQYDATAPTGTCGVVIVGKERSLVTNLGAANEIKVAHLSHKKVDAAMNHAKLFYFTGFTLTISLEHLIHVAQRSLDHDGVFAMNLSAPFIMEVPFFNDRLKEILPYVDILFSNDEEAKVFARTQGFGDMSDIKAIAQKAVAMPKKNGKKHRLVIFTCGKEPTVYADGSVVGEVAVDKIDPAKIVDTNGAGDSFVGGFLAAYSRGKTVVEAIKAGNYAAGVIIQHDGCTFPATPSWTL